MAASGYGNFIEIGPYNLHMKPRRHTWIKDYNVLFVDSPIGTGFSYFSEKNATLLTSTEDIGGDLVTFLRKFLQNRKEFATTPLYIFGESYGGKMAAEFAYQLEKEIRNGIMDVNLKGIGLGDSYTSPIDYVLNYAPFALTIVSIILTCCTFIGCSRMLDDGRFENWRLSYYPGNSIKFVSTLTHVELMSYEKKCNKFMNSFVKARLGIPRQVTWHYTNRDIYNALDEDIMRSVTDRIEYLLNNTNVKVVVYNGIFDFIVNTSGKIILIYIDKKQTKNRLLKAL
ncbi:serine protease family s10 serine carboxypeptidase [Holotrichia oblita]|uniref:Serine protease family s10 serine carboxypeptidase n=1 Tax=Holotrichia oblita TaxID=644536 RepID=A0ACB9TQR4_HOLOL|nr:serine protease family s10 serine carboxypeptidase [Holotrichia oblita]